MCKNCGRIFEGECCPDCGASVAVAVKKPIVQKPKAPEPQEYIAPVPPSPPEPRKSPDAIKAVESQPIVRNVAVDLIPEKPKKTVLAIPPHRDYAWIIANSILLLLALLLSLLGIPLNQTVCVMALFGMGINLILGILYALLRKPSLPLWIAIPTCLVLAIVMVMID